MANVEQIVSLPIINPDTGVKAHRCFMGKVDLIEGHKIIDYKGVEDPARFVAQLRIGYQIELYNLPLMADGTDIWEAEYRLISRPTITMCGKDRKLAESSRVPVSELYEERCLEWLLDDPGKMTTHNYFINADKLEQARWYLWDSSRRLLDNKRHNRWLPNTHACFAWERECQYLPLCDAVQNGADVDWIIKTSYRIVTNSHPELGERGKLNIVTYSSLRDLHLCEMIYLWKHIRRLRKGTGESSEALWIGSAMHAGMEKIREGESVALEAVNAWADKNPVLGEKEHNLQEQQVARSRAMVRAAMVKWPVEINDAKA